VLKGGELMTPIEKLKFVMKGKTGLTYTVTFEGVQQALGICKLREDVVSHARRELERFDTLWDAITDLRTHVVALWTPQAVQAILSAFRLNKQLDTRQVNLFIAREESQVKTWALHEAFKLLQEDGTLIAQSQGKGNPRLWRLVRDPMALVPSRR